MTRRATDQASFRPVNAAGSSGLTLVTLSSYNVLDNNRRKSMQATRTFLAITAMLLAMPLIGSEAVTTGDEAPDFRLMDQKGDWHQLADYSGKWVAVYFYPKDDTPGCTTEACAYRDNIFAFEEIGATILGVSLDDVESHAAFAEK